MATDLCEVSEVIASKEAADMECQVGNRLHHVIEIQEQPSIARIPTDKTAQAMLEARTIRQRFDSVDEMLKSGHIRIPINGECGNH